MEHTVVRDWIKPLETKKQWSWQEAQLFLAYKANENLKKLIDEMKSLEWMINNVRDELWPLRKFVSDELLVKLLKSETKPRTSTYLYRRTRHPSIEESLNSLIQDGKVVKSKTRQNRSLYSWNGSKEA